MMLGGDMPPSIFQEKDMSVRMKALKAWHNAEYEGTVIINQEFNATEDRARDLERGQLAVRVVSKPKLEVQSAPPRPLEFGEAGKIEQSSSSPPAQAQPMKTSRKSGGERKFL
jgi:hypothetical protein